DLRDRAHADGGRFQAGRNAAVSERAADDALGQTESAALHTPAGGTRPALLQGQPRLALHPLVFRAAAAFARRPAWSEHVSCFAIHAVRSVDPQTVVSRLVNTGRTHVGVEPRDVAWDIVPSDQMARDR